VFAGDEPDLSPQDESARQDAGSPAVASERDPRPRHHDELDVSPRWLVREPDADDLPGFARVTLRLR